MQIRTLRPTEIAGRRVRAFAVFDLPAAEAEALIDDGAAEIWVPEGRGALPPAAAPTDPQE